MGLRPSPSPLSLVDNVAPAIEVNDEVLSKPSFDHTVLKRSSASEIPSPLELKPHPAKDIAARSAEELNQKPSLDRFLGHGGLKSPQLRVQDIHPGTRIRTPDVSKEPQFTEWKAPVYQPLEGKPRKISSAPLGLAIVRGLRVSGSFSSAEDDRIVHEDAQGAKTHAEEYQAMIRNLFPESPESSNGAFGPNSNHAPSSTPSMQPWPKLTTPSPLSPRISDVLDQPLMPEILQIDGEENSDCCSSCASEIGELSETPRKSLHVDKEHSIGRRPSSKYSTRGARPESAVSASEGGKNRQVQQRKNLQQGLSEAYETLHRRISSKPPSNPPSDGRDHSKKVWDTPEDLPMLGKIKRRNRSDTSPSPMASMVKGYGSHSSFSPIDERMGSSKLPRANTDIQPRSVGRKLASAFYDGTARKEHHERPSKSKVKRGTANERREELKKKITVVFPERIEGAKF